MTGRCCGLCKTGSAGPSLGRDKDNNREAMLEQKMKSKQRMNVGPRSLGIFKLQMHLFSGFVEEMWAHIRFRFILFYRKSGNYTTSQ